MRSLIILQESETKGKGQSNLLSFLQLQLPNLGQWEKQNEQVGEDGRGGIGDPSSNLIDAFTWYVGVPQLLDRNANENEEKGNTDDPREDENADKPRHFLEKWDVEDAVIHQHQAQLRPAQVPGVENLCDNKIFGHQYDVIHINLVGMNAHAHRVHHEDEGHYDKIPKLSN